MSTIGTINIGFGVGVQQLKSGLASASVALTTVSNSWANLGGAVTAARGAIDLVGGSIRAATGLITDMVMAASDLDESMNLVQVQFGGGASTVVAAAQEMADKFGIVKSEFLQGAGNLGVVVEAMGKGEQATAAMSVELTKLAGDLASIRNMRFEDVMVGLRAGLGGESEPLKNLGVFINEAVVKQEAYRAGIAKVGKELIDGEKIQARYNLIMAQTSKAQGDLARTADGVANSVRSIQGRIENLKADAGGAFSVISQALLVSVGEALISVGGQFGAVRDGLKKWAEESLLYGGVVNEAVGLVGMNVAGLADGWSNAGAGFANFRIMVVGGLARVVEMLGHVGEYLDAMYKVMAGTETHFAKTAFRAAKFLREGGEELQRLRELAEPDTTFADSIRAAFSGMQQRLNQIGMAADAATAPLVTNTATAAANLEKAAKVQLGGALEMGSGEARSAILSARVNPADTVGKEQVALQKDANDLHRQGLAALQGLTDAFKANFQLVKI